MVFLLLSVRRRGLPFIVISHTGIRMVNVLGVFIIPSPCCAYVLFHLFACHASILPVTPDWPTTGCLSSSAYFDVKSREGTRTNGRQKEKQLLLAWRVGEGGVVVGWWWARPWLELV